MSTAWDRAREASLPQAGVEEVHEFEFGYLCTNPMPIFGSRIHLQPMEKICPDPSPLGQYGFSVPEYCNQRCQSGS